MKFKTARPKKAGKREDYQFPSSCRVLVSDGKANCAPDNLSAVLGFVLREFTSCEVLHTGALQAGNIAIENKLSLSEASKRAIKVESDLIADMQGRIDKSPAAQTCRFTFTSYANSKREGVRDSYRPIVKERLIQEQSFRDDLTESVLQFWKRRSGKEIPLEREEDKTLRKATECIMLDDLEELTSLDLPDETIQYLKNSCYFLIDECADIGYWQGTVLYPGDLSPVLINMMNFINQRENRAGDSKLVFVGVKVKETNIRDMSVWDDIRQVTNPSLSAGHSTQKVISKQFLDTCVLQDPELSSPSTTPISLAMAHKQHGLFRDIEREGPGVKASALSTEELEAIRYLFAICRYVSQSSQKKSMAFLVEHHSEFSDIAKRLPTGFQEEIDGDEMMKQFSSCFM